MGITKNGYRFSDNAEEEFNNAETAYGITKQNYEDNPTEENNLLCTNASEYLFECEIDTLRSKGIEIY